MTKHARSALPRRLRAGLSGMLGLVLAALPLASLAHSGIHEQIEAVTRRLAAEPENPQLYVQRGELYRLHQDWDQALADFETALQLDAGAAEAALGLGRTRLEQGLPQQALAQLDRALALQPDAVRTLVTRARCYRALGQPLAAAADYSRAIEHFPGPANPLPEYYLERARAYAAAGTAHIDQALQGLDAGLQRLGDIHSLARYAVDLEAGRGNYAAALRRLDPLLARATRKEGLLLKRGDILLAAHRQQAARQAFLDAQAALAALPPRHRHTRSMQQLQAALATRLQATEQPAGHAQ